MKIERFSRGGTVRLYLEILSGADGQTGESPTVAIQRVSDGLWLDGTAEEFVSTRQDNALTELDNANLPGLYYFDFDYETDGNESNEFLARFVNTGANALLEHRSIVFGAIPDVVEPGLCTITGTIYTADGEAASNAQVLGTVIPVNYDSLGRGYQHVEIEETHTDLLGQFELSFVRGLNVRLEIPSIGYDRRVEIPDQSSALFTDL